MIQHTKELYMKKKDSHIKKICIIKPTSLLYRGASNFLIVLHISNSYHSSSGCFE